MTKFRTRLRRTTTLAVAASVTVALAAASPASAIKDRDCADFKTQAKAQKFFKKHKPKKDPHRLDADNDGKACEELR
jgi:hypothetical protein